MKNSKNASEKHQISNIESAKKELYQMIQGAIILMHDHSDFPLYNKFLHSLAGKESILTVNSSSDKDLFSALNISEGTVNQFVDRANLLFKEDKKGEASLLYTLLATGQPLVDSHWFSLAFCLYQMCNFNLSIFAIENAISINDKQPEYHLLYASALFAVGQHNESRKQWEKAHQLLKEEHLSLSNDWKAIDDELTNFLKQKK